MRISHITLEPKPLSSIVRHYENSIVMIWENSVKNLKDKLPDELGQWKIKYKNFVAKEYLTTFTMN